MHPQRVYSPTQASMAAFLGGPLAATVAIAQNFRVLGNDRATGIAAVCGAAVILLMLGTLPFLPENFPNMLIPLVTVVITRTLVEKLQFTKPAIEANEALAFHSNWRVFGMGVGCMLAMMAMIFAAVFGLDALGVALPA